MQQRLCRPAVETHTLTLRWPTVVCVSVHGAVDFDARAQARLCSSVDWGLRHSALETLPLCTGYFATLHWRLCNSAQEALPLLTRDSATLNWRLRRFAIETLAFSIGYSCILQWKALHSALETLYDKLKVLPLCNGNSATLHWRIWHSSSQTLAFCIEHSGTTPCSLYFAI